MNWEFAHTMAITIAGNTYLQGRDVGAFWPEAPVFVFTRAVNFVSKAGSGACGDVGVAADPLEWFSILSGNCHGLLLRCPWLDDPANAETQDIYACRSGPSAFIEAIGANGSSIWLPEYSIDRQSDGRKSSSFTYRESGESERRELLRDAAAITSDFDERLLAIADFADREGLDVFSESFNQALQFLWAGSPPSNGWQVESMEGARLPLHARQWLAACSSSWAYGGNGSWTDRGFPPREQEEFVEVTRRLYQIQVEAAVAATNASYDGQ